MEDFTPDEKYVVTGNSCGHDRDIGSIVTVAKKRASGGFYYAENPAWFINAQDVKKITTTKSTSMELTKKFALVFKAEPQKSFIKAGITDANDILTSDGQAVFLAYLLKQNGDAFKKDVVDPILADEAASKE